MGCNRTYFVMWCNVSMMQPECLVLQPLLKECSGSANGGGFPLSFPPIRDIYSFVPLGTLYFVLCTIRYGDR